MEVENRIAEILTVLLKEEFAIFQKLSYKKISDTFYDKIQKIKGVFIKADNQPCLELLENLGEN